MKFTLDYDKMILLDAQELAEAGIKQAYGSIVPDYASVYPSLRKFRKSKITTHRATP